METIEYLHIDPMEVNPGSCRNTKATGRKVDEAHISRLEHILGGKSRRASAGQDRFERESKNIKAGFHPQLMHGVANHSSIASDDLELEIAMKQLMEATHDALVNMKAEILRMQYDLERALVEISLLRQREELLQHHFKDKALELEKEFMKRIDDLQQTMILEFAICKQESEQIMLVRLESLLNQMKEIHNTNDDIADIMAIRSQNQTSVSGCTENMELRHGGIVRSLRNAPTPSESSSAANADNGKLGCLTKRMSTMPMPYLVDSLKEEAKHCAAHRQALSIPPKKSCTLPFEASQFEQMGTPSNKRPADFLETEVNLAEIPQQCFEGNNFSPVSVLHGNMQDCKERPLFQLPLHPDLSGESKLLFCWDEHGCCAENIISSEGHRHERLPTLPENFHVGKQPPPSMNSQDEKKLLSSSASGKEGGPALRILKPENFKIADFLVSDSEEDFT